MRKQIIRREITQLVSGSLPPLLSRIYSARGITSENQIQRQLKGLHHYTSLKDIGAAAQILADAIEQQKQILIVGDFDCDGATSSALGTLAIRGMGGRLITWFPTALTMAMG